MIQGEASLPAGITLDGTSLEVADDTAEGVYTIDVFANDGTVRLRHAGQRDRHRGRAR